VKAGSAVIELANFGQDPHDLRVQRIGARHIAGLGDVVPGARGELTVKLAPGRYSFWCSIANHRKLGMRATLVVTR
jgi:plastocyanin